MSTSEIQLRIRRAVLYDLREMHAIDRAIRDRATSVTYPTFSTEHIFGANLDKVDDKKRSGLMAEVAKLLDLGFVAESEGQMCGFIVGRETYVIERDAEVGEIAILGIHPDFQRKGIASKLVDAIVDLFKSRDITIVRTRLHPDDKIMSGFFQRIGFAGEPLISYTKAI